MGPGGGANVLKTAVASGQFYGNDVRASLSIPSFGKTFDPTTTTVLDAGLDAQLRTALASFETESEAVAA